MRRLTRETCDQLVNIPMLGSVESLNVSVASAVCLYETVRQRSLIFAVFTQFSRIHAAGARKPRRDSPRCAAASFRPPELIVHHAPERLHHHHPALRPPSIRRARAVHKPMHPSSEFAYEDARELAAVFQGKAGFTYARQGTPTTTALEAKITRMEGGKGSVSFSTGMAALSAIFTTLLRRGDHLVSSQYVFGNTNSLLGTLLELGVEISFVDATDSAQVREAIRPNTRMVFTETIANPGTQVADLAVIGEICERGLVYVVDNTLTSPWMFRPSSVGPRWS